MRALIVFESLWGNTEKIARAVATELASAMNVDVMRSDAAPPSVDGYDLVVVGGPTHAFSMSRASTREEAVAKHGLLAVPGSGIREWLDSLKALSTPVPAATFDTRVDSPRLPGSAAKGARRELRSLGFDVSVEAKTFRVHGMQGPLVDGEVEKAIAWAKELRSAISLSA